MDYRCLNELILDKPSWYLDKDFYNLQSTEEEIREYQDRRIQRYHELIEKKDGKVLSDDESKELRTLESQFEFEDRINWGLNLRDHSESVRTKQEEVIGKLQEIREQLLYFLGRNKS